MYQITNELLGQITNYLAQRPYAEVAKLIQGVQEMVQVQSQVEAAKSDKIKEVSSDKKAG
jgi:hypothetical protein